ncbi:MAG TPA: aldehyde dehydrogenase family protein [Woeseiaceae bacterium]|nr:aldehyde dehydrogenase family protein [Woeseiaceae bacterium]
MNTTSTAHTLRPDPLRVRNPRTGELDFELEVATAADIAPVAQRLRAAQKSWRALGVDGRVEVMQNFRDALAAHREPIVTALEADTGRRRIAATEIDAVMSFIDNWARLTPELTCEEPERPASGLPRVGVQQRLEPYPLLGAITPWNFPLLLSFIDAIPALFAGCAALIKPSEVTPRFSVAVEDCVATVPVLRDVLGFVRGDGRTGAALIEHVDVVAFTGSVATGKKVAAAAATAFVPAFLELGGKDPVIVLPGSDLDRATTAILRASVLATGQACQSLERIYVHDSQHDAFVELLAEKARAASLSHPHIDQGIIGPLIFDRQAEIIRRHIEDAVEKGARIVTGGEIRELDGGLWIEPTVLTGVDHSMAVMTEETFGPVMPVMKYAEEAEAIALANDTQFGLSAAVFGASDEAALRVAESMVGGGISINDAGMSTMVFDACKMAFRQSGMGPSRMGSTGITRYLRQKALYINRGPVVPIEAVAEDQQDASWLETMSAG